MASCDEPYADDGTSRGASPCDSVANNTTPLNPDSVWKDPLEIGLDEDSGL